MNLKLRNSLESYNGVPLDALQHIPEISFYNHNYYIGLRREGCVTSDLIYAESDDDNCTSYYLINKNSEPIYFGYSFTSEGDIIRTDLDFWIKY